MAAKMAITARSQQSRSEYCHFNPKFFKPITRLKTVQCFTILNPPRNVTFTVLLILFVLSCLYRHLFLPKENERAYLPVARSQFLLYSKFLDEGHSRETHRRENGTWNIRTALLHFVVMILLAGDVELNPGPQGLVAEPDGLVPTMLMPLAVGLGLAAKLLQPAADFGLPLEQCQPAVVHGLDLELCQPAAGYGLRLELHPPAAGYGLALKLHTPAAGLGLVLEPRPPAVGGGLALELPPPAAGYGLAPEPRTPATGGGLASELPPPAAASGLAPEPRTSAAGGGLASELPPPAAGSGLAPELRPQAAGLTGLATGLIKLPPPKPTTTKVSNRQSQTKLLQTVNHAKILWDPEAKPKGIFGGHINIRSLPSKTEQMEKLLYDSNLDYLGLTETWLKKNTPAGACLYYSKL